MLIVSNTSPIINLAAIGRLDILKKLFNKIIIPEAVYKEIVVIGAGLAGAKEVENSNWIITRKVDNKTLVKAIYEDLDIGEAEALALAIELKADLLLLDERIGRKIASRFEVSLLGVLGILMYAKQKKEITSVRPLMDELIVKAGFWISTKLYEQVLIDSGEKT